ncbi:diacylglycerol kinase family protein [Microbacteriaceae bacterium 4G12]
MRKRKLIESFQYAFQGIIFCVSHERNMKIHCVAAVLVILSAWRFQVTKVEWLILLLTIGGVLSLEIMNTAIEKAVDLTTTDVHPLAKVAKDAAAGAVLLFSCIAVIIGIVIFLPYVF